MKTEIHDLFERLAEVEESLGAKLQPPCSAEQVESLRARARAELAAELPSGYTELLCLTDGIEWDGLTIYGSRTSPAVDKPEYSIPGFVEANRRWREYDPNGSFLFFGEADDDMFVFNLSESRYEITERQSRVIETFRTFEELLAEALRPRL